jgi:hypothetical protein
MAPRREVYTMMGEAEHNEARWYRVRWLDEHRAYNRSNLRQNWRPAGWYVLRVCPCHRNQPVTERPYPDEASARHGLEVILSVTPT